MMSSRDTGVGYDAPRHTPAGVGLEEMRPPLLSHDVRLLREITHRRLAFSLLRRMIRVLTLHVLDATLVAAALVATLHAAGSVEAGMPYLPAVVVTFLLCLNAVSAYNPGDARRDRRRLLSGVVLAVLMLTGLAAFPPHLPLSPLLLAALALTALLALATGRKVADWAVRQVYARGIGLRRAVVVGSLEEVGVTLRKLRRQGSPDQYVVGHLTPQDQEDPASLGTIAALDRVLDEMEVAEVLVAAKLSAARMAELAAVCFERGAAVFVVPSAATDTDFFSEAVRMGDCPLLRLHPARLEMPKLLVKRAVDLVLSVVALVLLAPFITLVAVAIKLDSPGPVFFRHDRIGLGGARFRMWKFRSMAVDAEAQREAVQHLDISGGSGPFKAPNDPRVTRVGRLLRRTSMDELPQLLNVIRGEMSLVGPRPVPPCDVARFKPWHFARLSVVPGITGPWQVNGRNLITDFETIVQMEREYIAGWSLLLDARIILKTFGVVARGEGAY
jgi:exopolysaccharide biosynthesis polyprenyl glycosylphosphotransferase